MRHRQETRPSAARQEPANQFEILRSDAAEEPDVQAADARALSEASTKHAEGSLEAASDDDSDIVVLDASSEEEWLNDIVPADLDDLTDIDDSEDETSLSPRPVPAPTNSSPLPTTHERTRLRPALRLRLGRNLATSDPMILPA